MFHAPTFAGLRIKAEPLWSDLTRSRYALELALDYGCMQKLESFFYRHRSDAPRTAKTRKMEPKQIYVHGDYKNVSTTKQRNKEVSTTKQTHKQTHKQTDKQRHKQESEYEPLRAEMYIIGLSIL